MNRLDSINALIKRSTEQLSSIRSQYEKSLHDREISTELILDIKDYLSNLRSVLDYIAHDIVEKYCPDADPRDNLYFPICSNLADFSRKISRSYPNLHTTEPDIHTILENSQPYNAGNEWLSQFNKLNNEQKHNNLVPQVRNETKRIEVKDNEGGIVSWDPGAVKFGPGVFISGVPINPLTQMPVPDPSQQVTIQTWVDFKFEGLDISAISLLSESLKRITEIVDKLQNKL